MFMKKWWLKFETEEGNCWSGWINTTAEKRGDFPETLTGTFWTMRDEEGTWGEFELGDKNYEGNYVLGSMKGKEVILSEYERDVEGFRRLIDSLDPLETWEREERRIEDCLNMEMTYITEY